MSGALLCTGLRSPRTRARADGALHDVSAQEVLAQLYRGLLDQTGLAPGDIDDVILGCATQHGEQAGNIAKTSTLYAGWEPVVPGITVNRYCSSGIDALALAAMKVEGGYCDAVIAGGVEMMSRVPMLSDDARVFRDPEFALQCRVLLMGSGADLIASRAGIGRELADAMALRSQRRAAAAQQAGWLDRSLLPISTSAGMADRDECIREGTTAQSLAALAPAFATLGASGVDAFQLGANPQLDAIDHIHTAGNSPAMADAACAMIVASPETVARKNLSPRGRIVTSVTCAADPLQVLTGCIEATRLLLQRCGLRSTDVDLFEIHEAFAATSVLAQRELALDEEQFNVNGGVIALGHPMGATGGIMALSLLDELERRDLRRGVVAAAGAAGSGSALLIERESGW